MSKNKYLNNSEIEQLRINVDSFESKASDALFDQFKNLYIATASTSYKGKGADTLKQYLMEGPGNIISGMLDIVEETKEFARQIEKAALGYEKNKRGKVEQQTLEDIKNQLKNKESKFDELVEELNGAKGAASKYISTKSLETSSVSSEFKSVKKSIKNMSDDLQDLDDELFPYIELLRDRIDEMNKMIDNVKAQCFKKGKFNPKGAQAMSKKTWYEHQTNVKLNTMISEDAFFYDEESGALEENQWAKGWYNDVYAYAGYATLERYFKMKDDGGEHTIELAGAVLGATGYAQFTDYLRAKGEVKFLYGEYNQKYGLSGDYFGFSNDWEVGAFKADGSAEFGTDDFYTYIKGDVELLTAGSEIACEYDDGDIKIGVKANATAASASGKVGINGLEYKTGKGKVVNGKFEAEKESLFSVGAKAEGSVGASAGIMFETKQAIDWGKAEVRTAELDIDLVILGGGELDVKVPFIAIKPLSRW